MDRRRFIVLGAAGSVAVLTGCGGSDAGGMAPMPPTGTAPPPAGPPVSNPPPASPMTPLTVGQPLTDLVPFLPGNEAAYVRWRERKLAARAQTASDLVVEVRDPRALTAAEHAQIVRRCRRDNMAIYASAATDEDKSVPRRVGRQLGLATLDTNFLADEDGITSIAVTGAKAAAGFIPYTTHRIRWHTDGYYNPPELRIRAMLLHCVRDAASGGDTALLDHDLAYLLLRDDDPAHVRALSARRPRDAGARRRGRRPPTRSRPGRQLMSGPAPIRK